MRRIGFGLAAVTLIGCASGGYPVLGGREPDVVIVGEEGRRDRDRDRRDRDDRDRDRRSRGYRTLHVPPGHYPRPGECRVWYAGRPPGHQPRAVRCDRLYGRAPRGAFILYNRNAWDADYDWYQHERRYRNSVPRVIIEITRPRRR